MTLNGSRTIQARYWYDGAYVNNAKEDAAEMALRTLTSTSPNGMSATPASPAIGTNAVGGWAPQNEWGQGQGGGGLDWGQTQSRDGSRAGFSRRW